MRCLSPALLGVGLSLALALPETCAPASSAPASPAPRKTFLGQVLSVDRANRWFVMKGGSSKRYPEVKMLLGKDTRWGGVAPKPKALKPGDVVRAEGTLVDGTTFRAVTVSIQQPMTPSARGASGLRKR
jgi:hypothetical protein